MGLLSYLEKIANLGKIKHSPNTKRNFPKIHAYPDGTKQKEHKTENYLINGHAISSHACK